MKWLLSIHFASVIFSILIGFAVDKHLEKDYDLSDIGQLVICVFCGFIAYLFAEWIIFKFDWQKYKKEIEKLKFTRCLTGDILNEFAESNFLMERMSSSIKQDLLFDKIIKNDKKQWDFHLFLSELKYHDYLPSHFIYSADDKLIKKVPTYYFQTFVWRRLVEMSNIYQSIQILEPDTESVYIKNTNRLNAETNFLQVQLRNATKTHRLKTFEKIFVIEDEWVDLNNRNIKIQSIRDYLITWHKKFSIFYKSGKAKLKIIRTSEARGIINNGKLDDIGIFGDILGIQSVVNNTENNFCVDNVRIDFYFDIPTVNKYKNEFVSISNRSKPLS